MNKYYIIQSGIVLPGLHSWPTAHLQGITNHPEDAANLVTSLKYLDKLEGTPFDYTIISDVKLAKHIVNDTNFQKELNLCKWRKEVYGEEYDVAKIEAQTFLNTDKTFKFYTDLNSGKI